MIIFESIEVQNFLSWGNTPTTIDFTANHLNLITGKSGSGKSSLMTVALFYCLFGKTYKNINKPTLINSVNSGGMLVVVKFSCDNKKFTVRRGIKPNIFEIYENDELIPQTAESKDYQQELETNILKMDDRIFKQVVFVGSSTYVPFLKLPLALRRDIIENILNIKIYSVMLTKLKEKITAQETVVVNTDHEIKNLRGKLEVQERMTRSIIDNNEERITEIQTEVSNLQLHREKVEKGISMLNGKIQAILREQLSTEKNHDMKNHIDEIKNKITEHTLRKRKIEEEIHFINNNNHCHTCSQEISSEIRDVFISDRKAQLDDAEENLKTLNEKMASGLKVFNAILDMERTMMMLHQKLKDCNDKIQWKEKEIITIQSQSQEQIVDGRGLIDEIEEKQQARESFNAHLITLKSILPILKDTGVKTRIIKQYLNKMNGMLNTFLELLNLPVSFNLNEEFKEEIKSRYRDKFSYENFSDGEQARIDLAIMLMLREVSKMKNAIDTNLLILDEADSALDEESRKAFFNLYRRVLSNKNIFVISHHCEGEAIEKYDKIYRIEKSGNFSTLL